MKKITDLKEGDLLPVEMAARMLGVSKSRMYDWHAKAKLEPHKYPRGVKFGGLLFFLKSDLIARLNKQFAEAS